MTNETESLLRFPCEFPVKAMGLNSEEFKNLVRSIVRKHLADDQEVSFSNRLSSGNKYLAITATFIAQNIEQIHAIYGDLKKSPLVLTAL